LNHQNIVPNLIVQVKSVSSGASGIATRVLELDDNEVFRTAAGRVASQAVSFEA
jgi:hypothetical protein